MATTYNIQMNQFNGTDYDVLNPSTVASIVSYDNSTSGAQSNTVQGATDEAIKKATDIVQNLSIATSDWSASDGVYTATKSVVGVTSSSNIFVTPDTTSIQTVSKIGAYCSGQSSGSIVFTSQKLPTSSVGFNILIRGS